MERTLLLVDDEPNILSALNRVFRGENYRIFRANSGAEGLELLKEQDVGVIISDQRMPGMTGVEFLSQVNELYPDTVRIVLSGYTDLNSVTDAINQGAIYKFLTKPWEDDLLKKNIREAFRHYELHVENERLNRELQMANEELSTINRELEQRVEEKTHEVLVNYRALQVAQDVMEYFPAAVLGIADDGLIAFANKMAKALCSTDSGLLIGGNVDELNPKQIRALYDEVDQSVHVKQLDLGDQGIFSAMRQRLADASSTKGTLLILTPSLSPPV